MRRPSVCRRQIPSPMPCSLAFAGCTGKKAIDYGCGTGLVGLQLAGCFGSLLLAGACLFPPDVARPKER